MSKHTFACYEQDLQAQAIDDEIHLAGMRAGAAAARYDWPDVARAHLAVLGRCQCEMKKLFGGNAGAAAGALGYRTGWIEGYGQCRALLDRQSGYEKARRLP
jgi:hypothetical protein